MRFLKSPLSASFVLDALYSTSPNILAMLLLKPAEYGKFSLLYVMFALGATVALSTVSEPWSRGRARGEMDRPGAYPIVLSSLSLVMALLAFCLSLFLQGGFWFSLFAAIAVGANIFRGSMRYRSVALGQFRKSLTADALSLITLASLLLVLVLWLKVSGSIAVYVSWGFGAIVAMPILTPALGPLRASVKYWVVHYKYEIRTLLQDSSIAMINNSLMPFVLAPVLGIANFGIYRAMENVTAILRIIVSGFRPFISRVPPEVWNSRKLQIVQLVAAVAAGAGTTGALLVLNQLNVLLGTLSALSDYAYFAGVIVITTGLSNFLNTIARTYLAGRHLIVTRILTVAVAVLTPLTGALFLGLLGALTGLIVERFFSVFMWRFALHKKLNR